MVMLFFVEGEPWNNIGSCLCVRHVGYWFEPWIDYLHHTPFWDVTLPPRTLRKCGILWARQSGRCIGDKKFPFIHESSSVRQKDSVFVYYENYILYPILFTLIWIILKAWVLWYFWCFLWNGVVNLFDRFLVQGKK